MPPRLLLVAPVLVVAALIAVVATRPADAPPPPAVAVQVPTASDVMSVVWVGDVGLGADPSDADGLDALRPLLVGDYALATAAAPITALTGAWDPQRPPVEQMAPPAARALAAAGVDGLVLSDARVMDRGPQGLDDSLAHAQEAGLAVVGAGQDLDQAQQPLVLRADALTLGVVAFTEYVGRDSTADGARPGAVVLDRDTVRQGIERARAAGAQHVIAAVRWGDEGGPVSARQRYWAATLSEAGYAAVIGTGSRTVQPIAVVGRTPVVYGLGEFVTTAPSPASDGSAAQGLVVTTHVERNGAITLTVRCVRRESGSAPVPCSAADAERLLPALHPHLQVTSGLGVLQPGRVPAGG